MAVDGVPADIGLRQNGYLFIVRRAGAPRPGSFF
jgi:hypothetical protein